MNGSDIATMIIIAVTIASVILTIDLLIGGLL
jgi:hypothetical protein